MTKKRPSKNLLPDQIAKAIRHAWPEGVVDMPGAMDEAPFWSVYSELKASLSQIPEIAAIHEREPGGGPRWDEGSVPGEDIPAFTKGWQSCGKSGPTLSVC